MQSKIKITETTIEFEEINGKLEAPTLDDLEAFSRNLTDEDKEEIKKYFANRKPNTLK